MIGTMIRKIIGHTVYAPLTLTDEFGDLKGKAIVVTGGGSGIGKEIAKTIARSGGRPIIVGRNKTKLESAAQDIGGDCFCYQYDMEQTDENTSFFEDVESQIAHSIDGLVNNAGIYIQKDVTLYTVEDFDKTININLRAPMFMSIAYIKYCRKKGYQGNIVMTSSNRSLFGDYGPYGISKRGLNHFVKGLAREMIGSGIRVNAVAPGMTASDINGIDAEGDLYTRSAKGERVIRPEEIAEIVCFLLSERSRCINGVIIPCDEGDSLR